MSEFDILKSFIEEEKHISYIPNIIPSNDFEWIKKESNVGFLPLLKDIPYDDIYQEIMQIKYLFSLHREECSYGWYGFCIHGKSRDATRGDEFYNDTRPHKFTDEAVKFMPKTVNFFKNNWFGNEFLRVRIMKLIPGGYIEFHQDDDLPGALGAVNIAVNNPVGHYFAMKNYGIVPFKPGRAIMLNIANPHAILNDSHEDRYHIIVHHKSVTDEFKKIVINSYNGWKND